jgi:lipopolysaccharide/colanic/teichoic acid biosynthesis glycosyltransferase
MRRIADFTAALLILCALTPLLALIAVAIMVSSPGSPFYTGWRVGKNGKRFRMWKFRTMVPDATRIGPPITVKADSRVTPLGKLLRKTKFDELPQFVNVLLGDMTLVGPRPELPEIVDLYDARQRAVLSVKPGVTGPVQLRWCDESEAIPEGDRGVRYYLEHLMDHKLRVDLEYLRTRTFLTDAQVVWDTAAMLLRRLIAGPLRHRAPRDSSVTQ